MVKIRYEDPKKKREYSEKLIKIKGLVRETFGDGIQVETKQLEGISCWLDFLKLPETSFKSFFLRSKFWGDFKIGTFFPQNGHLELKSRDYESQALEFGRRYEEMFGGEVSIEARYSKL